MHNIDNIFRIFFFYLTAINSVDETRAGFSSPRVLVFSLRYYISSSLSQARTWLATVTQMEQILHNIGGTYCIRENYVQTAVNKRCALALKIEHPSTRNVCLNLCIFCLKYLVFWNVTKINIHYFKPFVFA